MHALPGCHWCQVNSSVRAGAHKRFIAELTSGYVLLHEFQYFPGHVLYVTKFHVENPRELEQEERVDVISDIMFLRDALDIACQPNSLDVLETGGPSFHTHFHLVPRYGTDVLPGEPAIAIGREIRESPEHRATDQMVFGYKQQIRSALSVLGVKILR